MGKDTAGHNHPDKHHDHDKQVPETRQPDQEHLDFSKKHSVFEIELEKKGPEFSHIDEQREEFIALNAGKFDFEVPVPRNIVGLIPRKGPLPATRNYWRPSSSFERNGVFNIQTKTLNTRIGFPFFFCFLLYGWYGHALLGRHYELYHDNGESNDIVYDKLATRVPPLAKIWLRPA